MFDKKKGKVWAEGAEQREVSRGMGKKYFFVLLFFYPFFLFLIIIIIIIKIIFTKIIKKESS